MAHALTLIPSSPPPSGRPDAPSHRTQETLLVNHVFGGYSRTQVVCCECRAVSRRYEHFMDVPIDIPADTEQLEDALNIYCQRECMLFVVIVVCLQCWTGRRG
jgi:ubiquitin carboxyl-terminal hydrolase 36/42